MLNNEKDGNIVDIQKIFPKRNENIMLDNKFVIHMRVSSAFPGGAHCPYQRVPQAWFPFS